MNLTEKEQNIGIKITKNGQNVLKYSVFCAKGAPSWGKKSTPPLVLVAVKTNMSYAARSPTYQTTNIWDSFSSDRYRGL